MSKSDDIKEGYRRGKSGSSDSTGWFDTPGDQKARDQAFREGAIDRERERIEREGEWDREQKARDHERELEDLAREREEQKAERERELLEEQERIETEAAERQEEILSEHRGELRQLQEEREQAERQRLDRYEDITKNTATLRATERLEAGGQLQSAELFDEAMQMYAEAMRLNPAMIEPHWFMGQCLLALNRSDDARIEFIKFLKLLALRRDDGIVQWWQNALETVVASFPSDGEVQGVLTKSLALTLPHFRASAVKLVPKLREAGRSEAAAALLITISETVEANFQSLPLVDKLLQAGGPDAASALVVRIAQSAPLTLQSLALLLPLYRFNLKKDALALLARLKDAVKGIPDQILLAGCEMNTHWALSHELVSTPATQCFQDIAPSDRLKAKAGLERLREGKEAVVQLAPEVYGDLVRILESRLVEWSPEVDQALRQEAQADALKAYNSRVEHPVNRFKDAPRNVKWDAETRLSELWKKELQVWSSITTAPRRPEAAVQPDKPVRAGSGAPIGLVGAVVIVVLILAALAWAVLQRQNGGEQPVLSTPAAQTAPQAVPRPPLTQSVAPQNTLAWVEPRTVVASWRASIGRGDGALVPNSTFIILSDGFEVAGEAGDGRWQFWKVAQFGLHQGQRDFVFRTDLDPQLSGAPAVTVMVPFRASDVQAAFAQAYQSWRSSEVGQQQLAKANRSGVQTVERREEAPTPPVVPGLLPSTMFEAEVAELSGSAKQSREHLGYSGSGYVDGYGLNGLGATTTFRVAVAAPGDYVVSLRYANATGRVMTLTIYVNGVSVARTAMPPLPNWNTWGDKAEVVQFTQGANTIAYRYDRGDTGNVNIDYIRIKPASSRPVPAPTPASRRAGSPEIQLAVSPEMTFTVIHRHGTGGLSGALVRQLLNGTGVTAGPNYCKGDVTITADGLSFKTIVTSDNRRDDVNASYIDIKKVERKEPEHLRVETDKHGNWDFFAESAVIEQIARALLTRSDLFKR